MPYAVTD